LPAEKKTEPKLIHFIIITRTAEFSSLVDTETLSSKADIAQLQPQKVLIQGCVINISLMECFAYCEGLVSFIVL